MKKLKIKIKSDFLYEENFISFGLGTTPLLNKSSVDPTTNFEVVSEFLEL